MSADRFSTAQEAGENLAATRQREAESRSRGVVAATAAAIVLAAAVAGCVAYALETRYASDGKKSVQKPENGTEIPSDMR